MKSEIEKIRKSNPNNEAITVLDEFLAFYGYSDYSSALDSFSDKFGISFDNQVVIYADDVLGWIPYIVYYPDNAFNEKSRREPLVKDDNYFKDLNKSKAYCAKFVIYKINTLTDIRKFLKNEI